MLEVDTDFGDESRKRAPTSGVPSEKTSHASAGIRGLMRFPARLVRLGHARSGRSVGSVWRGEATRN
jgi:hypothetical protein